MSKEVQGLTSDLVDYAKLILIAMILIALVYLVAESLFGMLPAVIGSIIIGLASVFIYATNEKVRKSVNDWIKGRKENPNPKN